MLVAYGPDNRLVTAREIALEQLQQWSREHLLHCPDCRGIVHLRGGSDKRTQLHFAHQKGECAWSTEAESERHARGKLVLANWLQTQYAQAAVRLEERLPEPNRIADVFLEHEDGQRWAIEFQCAPLDIEEWRMRHNAYKAAGISDTWIIGYNRYEKQEAFIEAILQSAHEILFLDPLTNPPRIWLRWPVTRQQAINWQNIHASSYARHISSQNMPGLDGWVGRMGYGMTILSTLNKVTINKQANLVHPTRAMMEKDTRLRNLMEHDTEPQEARLKAYLIEHINADALRVVILPLFHAYQQNPQLLRHYNYGRGLPGQPITDSDRQRIEKAQRWLSGLARQGYTSEVLQTLFQELPFIGPYAAFAGYAEALLTIVNSTPY